jgi:SNF2 family DNA or RNA helicase
METATPNKQYTAQAKALDKAIARFSEGKKGTLLNMCMGTGKTRVAIEYAKWQDIFARSMDKTLVVLIACPLAVLPDPKALHPGGWKGEFAKWWPDNGPELYMNIKGTTQKRAQELVQVCKRHAGEFFGIPLVIAQSYESWRTPTLAKLYKAILRTEKFHVLFIMDESHRAKSPKSSKALTSNGAVCRFISDHADTVLLLTGTPMPHGPEDLWSQYYCVDKSLFGDNYFRFRSQYFITSEIKPGVKVIVNTNKRNLADLRNKFDEGAFTLKLEEALDLPSITHQNVSVSLSPREAAAYTTMEQLFFAELKDEIGDSQVVTAGNVLAKMGKLSQITGGAIKMESGDTAFLGGSGEVSGDDDGSACGAGGRVLIASSKGKCIEELLGDIEPNEPVVIFCRYKADIQICKWAAENCKRKVYELSGKRKELESWRAAMDGSVIVVQESAGGVGIDLTRARYAIYFSVNYSLGDYDQSVARLYRKGQERPVLILHLVAAGTIDETIREAIEGKRSVVDAVLARGGVDVSVAGEDGEYFDPFMGE